MARPLSLLTLTCISLVGCVGAREFDEIGLPGLRTREPYGRGGVARSNARDSAGFAVLPNPSFEELLPGNPDLVAGWTPVYSPLFAPSPFDGAHAIRISGRNRYYSSVVPPEPPYSRLAISSRFRGQTGEERGLLLTLHYWDGTPVYQGQRTTSSPLDWGTLYSPLVAFPSTDPFSYYLQTSDQRTWLDLDAVSLLRENFRDPAFNELPVSDPRFGWVLAGAASVSGGTATLSGHSALTQEVATLADGQTFFLAMLPASGSIPPAVREHLIATTGGEITSRTLTLFPASGLQTTDGWRVALSSPVEGACTSRYELVNESAQSTAIDKVTRGSITVFPRQFQPVENSPTPQMHFVATWLGENFTGSVDIADPGAKTVATLLLTGDGNSASAFWDGGLEPSGQYTAHFSLQASDGNQIGVTESFTIDRAVTYDLAGALQQDNFALGAWIWILRDDATMESLTPVFERAKLDGFNQALVFLRPDQHTAVRQICESLSLPFYVASSELEAPIKASPRVTTFDAAAYRDTLAGNLDDLRGSLQYRGLYIADEPFLPFALPNTGDALRVIDSAGVYGRGIYSMVPAQATPANYALAPAGVHFSDNYTFFEGQPSDLISLTAVRDYSIAQNQIARDAGLNYWSIPQSFSIPGIYRPPNQAASRALIGTELASGTKGLFPFVYRSIGGIEGIRDLDLDTTTKGTSWLAEFQRISVLDDVLMSLSHHTPVSSDPELFCTNATDPSGGRFAFLVNLDTNHPTSCALALTGTSSEVQDAETGESLAQNSDQAIVPLEAGDWRLLDLGGVELASVHSQPVDIAPPELIVPIRGIVSLGSLPVNALDIAPDGLTAVVAQSDGAHLVDLSSTPTPGALIPAISGASAAFTSNSLLISCDSAWGLYETKLSEGSPTTHDIARGTTGNADAVCEANGAVLVSTDYLGIRHFSRNADGSLEEKGRIPADDDIYGFVGPFDDSTFLAIGFFGIHRIDLTETTPTLHLEVEDSGFGSGTLSPSGAFLAVPQHERGFSLFEVDSHGHILSGSRITQTTEFANSTAWLDDSNLLVSDGKSGVRLLSNLDGVVRVDPRTWRPFGADSFATSLVARNGFVASGDSLGKVAFVETDAFPRAFSPSGWELH